VVQFCPKCMIAVRTLGAADKVLPFWKRLFTVLDATPPKTTARGHPGGSGSTPIDPESNLFRQIDKLRRDDNSDQALEHIRQWLKNGGRLSAALAGRYIDLLIQNGQSAELCSRREQLLQLLVQADDKRRAIAVFDICCAVEGDLQIDPAVLVGIGEMLAADGRARDAIRIYGAVIKHQPDASEAFLACFKASQIYHERLKAPEKAKKILRQLIQKYPEHSMLPDVKSYLKKIR
jgi:tetratricopeptide (TPR) repeat protein